MSAKRFYKTAFLVKNRKKFIQYLRNIGLLENSVTMEMSGDYYTCTIDLSHLNFSERKAIWANLSDHQTDFTK